MEERSRSLLPATERMARDLIDWEVLLGDTDEKTVEELLEKLAGVLVCLEYEVESLRKVDVAAYGKDVKQ